MTQAAIILVLVLLFSDAATADDRTPQCHSVNFPTKNTHGPFNPSGSRGVIGDLLEHGLQSIPEPLLVQAVLGAGAQVGLTSDQQHELKELFETTYSEINRDDQMAHMASALPYCLSSRPVTNGHYFLYIPADLAPTSETIVFLHGFGGNFQFYLKILKDEFPDHLIVVPSWGATWNNGNSRYIREVYDDIRQRFQIAISRAHLISISGGGAISFEIYSRNQQWFSDLTVFASTPRRSSIPLLRPDLSILMINGSQDSRFPISNVQRAFTLLRNRVPGSTLEIVDSDHFFFLSHIRDWRKIMKTSAGF